MQEILIGEDKIKQAVERIGKQISEDYSGRKLLVIGILKGSFVFMADLVRAIKVDDCAVDFISASSYRSGTVSSGNVVVGKFDKDVSEYDILLVEDILDTGRTLACIKETLMAKNPKSIRICTLLDKPSRRVTDINAEYVGFEIEDRFVIGYGLDFDQKYRNLPYIGEYIPEN